MINKPLPLVAILSIMIISAIKAQNYNPVSYHYNGTPTNGVKIKTNLPFQHGVGMPTVMLEGYEYGGGNIIDIKITWYIYNGVFHQANASSSGSYAPPIKLANESGKVVIFIDDRRYYNRFNVRVFANGKGETAAMFDGWTVVDEALSGSSVKDVVYENMFSGNVGIGTEPLDKLTVRGHVNIGDDANYRLRVRHVDGKSHVSRDLGDLHLNYNNGRKVLVGWGNTNPASDLAVAGRLGIGILNPLHHIDVINEHQATESFLRFRVKDAYSDYFQIANSTGSTGQFIPFLKGHRESDNRYSIQVIGETVESNDNGSTALVNFDARRNNGPIQARPLFVWTNYADKKMTMLANGNLGIGTTNPGSYKLAVNGHIRAKEIKVETGWADYVFKEDYDLPTLAQVEQHIQEKGHLINIPSAKEVEENGVELGEMNKLLLEKIEELTLYTLEQQKLLEAFRLRIKELELAIKK